MYDPPNEKEWVYTHFFDESYREAYDEGYEAAKKETFESLDAVCPYQESGHERDTTYQDELHYWWFAGYEDFKEAPQV